MMHAYAIGWKKWLWGVPGLCLLAATACRPTVPPDDIFGNDLLGNTSVELGDSLPQYWTYSEGDSAVFTEDLWTSSQGSEGQRALKIQRTSEVLDHFTWRQTLVNRVQRNKALVLRVMIRTENLSDPGAALMIRADNTEEPKGPAEQLVSSQGFVDILGSQEWTAYSLHLPEGLDRGLESLSVYLVLLPEATGTVYFDEITLAYEE